MKRVRHRLRSARAGLALLLATCIWLAGCATQQPAAGLPPQDPEPVSSVPPDTSPIPGSIEPAPPRAARTTVAILHSSRVPAQQEIAARIANGLSKTAYSINQIDIDALDNAPTATSVDANTEIVAAVGPDAFEIANQRFSNATIVYSQVLEPGIAASATQRIRGIAPTPPPALQFAAWAQVDSGLERIGLITSESFARIVADAERAAETIGALLLHRVSESDRETLFIFRRLANEIDGLWLAPDSAILSTAVIEEILTQATQLEISVLVFSDSLLDRGGLLSVSADSEHVAANVVEAIEAIRTGKTCSLPAEVPLDTAKVRVNARIAADLGLPPVALTEWIISAR